ncbi:peroxidase, partial [Rhagoletis pomonella]|uniref:peroxidase n=1 Tax=Rhagoletis pomonella TaxID=28610 RepID=UPI001784407C
MHLPSLLSPRRSLNCHYGEVNFLLIFLVGGLTMLQHVETSTTKAAIDNDSILQTTNSDYSSSSFSDENGISVELPKPLMLLPNRKQTADSIEAPTSPASPAKRQQRAYSHRPTLMDVALQASAREGLDAMTELYDKIVPDIIRKGHVLQDNHPAALLSKFSESVSESLEQEMAAYATISATKAFRKNYKYFNDLARQAHSSKISLRHTALEGLCPPRDPPTCMPASARYRTHDGTCNSKRRPRWGAAQMPFNRFLPPEYGDGVDSIRLSVEGGALASSRFVSLLVHGARDGEAVVTLMTAQWGQLLDHDMTSTAQPRSINGSVPSCCGNTDFHPSCFPIKVPLDDPWLAPLKVRCLEFLRSAPAQRRDCVLSWREQTNQATSYIDASPIYSNSVKSSDNARVFRNGLLVYGRGNPAEDVCHRGAIATQCIRAGDGRSGEQPGLLALHHVWVGEHNRIAMELSEMNLHWSDEKIYQETRRIIGAMFQHITYREFLPIVLGREVCRLFDLELLSSGFYQGYDPKTNPTVANSFAAAAFRFGHSLVQNSYMRCDRFHNFMRNNVSLHEEFQRGDIGSPGSLHRLLRGLVNQRALKRDEFITPELTNHLFQTPGFPFGLDLAAINIQRGRDHGVPPYTSWRVPCGLTPINSWEDFANVVGPQSAQRISHAYRSVHDIDLFVGGIAERPVVGGLVGPTFACIIAQQFSNSRKGDRFWYENGGFENSFTPAQLQSIRQVSLAQVLCRTVGGGTMQPHVFLPTDIAGNERQVCGTGALALLDLSPWIEQDPFATVTTNTAHEPDRVFEIITTNKMTETAPTVSLQVVKENKAGFSNRIRPTDHTNLVATGINSFVTGVQVPGEVIHISDKLDIRQKVSPAKRPTVTAKPIKGINNKLDKNPSRRPQSTRRTTAVVNNIPIELRSVGTDETGPNIIETKSKGISITNALSTTESMTVDKIEARIDDTDQEVGLLRLNDLPSTEQEEKHLDEQPNENL